MNHQVNTLDSASYGIAQQQRHRVLRNTYWLLALSLLVSVMTLGTGQTTVLQGAIHLTILASFLFLAAVP